MVILEFIFAMLVDPLCTMITLLMFLLKINTEALVNMLEATILGIITYIVTTVCMVEEPFNRYLNESFTAMLITPVICVVVILLLQAFAIRCFKKLRKHF